MFTMCCKMYVLQKEEIETDCYKQILYSLCKKDFDSLNLK